MGERNKKPLRKTFFLLPFFFFPFSFSLFSSFSFFLFSFRVGWEGLRWVDWTWLGWDRWVRWRGVGGLGRWIGLGWDSKMCSGSRQLAMPGSVRGVEASGRAASVPTVTPAARYPFCRCSKLACAMFGSTAG